MAQGKKPDYNVAVAVDGAGDRKTFVTIGVAWDGQTQDGAPCINVKLNAKPWQEWDGSMTLYRTRG